MKLILFDIDGTLVLTGGAGGRAMARAAQDIFGFPDADQSISMAGRTDTWIVAQMAAQVGATLGDDIIQRFHDAYIGHLIEEIERPASKKGLLPGVAETLEMLCPRADTYLGLLTGNFHRGARIKLEHFGIWDYFRGGAFGDFGEGEARDHHRADEIVPRRVGIAALELVLVRKGDGVNEEIERPPFLRDGGECGVE